MQGNARNGSEVCLSYICFAVLNVILWLVSVGFQVVIGDNCSATVLILLFCAVLLGKAFF